MLAALLGIIDAQGEPLILGAGRGWHETSGIGQAETNPAPVICHLSCLVQQQRRPCFIYHMSDREICEISNNGHLESLEEILGEEYRLSEPRNLRGSDWQQEAKPEIRTLLTCPQCGYIYRSLKGYVPGQLAAP